ncbi:MAG: type I-F CRISPR-associated endoribonuclease Cas6/Csy4 [Gammaproteobacteria bacterium]|nr:type I-F CRISPR-associated endoribonuclease Cas6/Csy4 [Gammaproteobacteria bacterium]
MEREEALVKIPADQKKTLRSPYIQLNSMIPGQTMRVYVERGKTLSRPTLGMFSRYDLSRTTTVPWFYPSFDPLF